MRSCLTSYHPERTQVAEPPMVSGTKSYMYMGTLCPSLLLFVFSFH